MTPDLVVFNIGGQKYEVSRSLLDMHSDSMLARSASKEWNSDNTGEIFMERNGTRFEFVLDYLRDRKVSLPPTVSKVALLDDLEYFGIQNIDEASIDEVSHTGLHFSSSSMYLHRELETMQFNEDCSAVARACIQHFLTMSPAPKRFSFSMENSPYPPSSQCDAAIRLGNVVHHQCNSYLEKFGLCLESVSKQPSSLELTCALL
jgi:hypothetical protein